FLSTILSRIGTNDFHCPFSPEYCHFCTVPAHRNTSSQIRIPPSACSEQAVFLESSEGVFLRFPPLGYFESRPWYKGASGRQRFPPHFHSPQSCRHTSHRPCHRPLPPHRNCE